MNDVDKGMKSDIKTLKISIEEGDVNFGREISDIRKDISLIVMDESDKEIYMEGFNLEELAYIKEELIISEGNVFDVSIGTNKKYHVMTEKLSENPLFSKNSWLVLIRDITYISDTSYFSSYMLVLAIFFLFVFFLLLIKFAIEWIFRALRELNDFGIALQGGKNPDLSVRFHKKYGNQEMDTLIGTLNSSVEKMEDSFKKMEEFSSNVSHELKTPITSMKSMIEVELSKERTKEEYQETLLKLSEETDWLSSIIRDLLVLTTNPQNIERGFKPVKLSKLGEEICDIMEIIALDEGIDLSWDFSGIEDNLVLCDGNSIKQAILNLVNNAIKYNKENGWIKVYGEVSEEKISLIVEDNGIGIKKENISRLTERFFREDNVRTVKKSGVGLGLSLVKHIIQVHKGSLDIYSEEGKGSIFKISLPRYSEG
jgi:signal transduction histidine kinase